ncbi:hypothetical protein FJZ17_00115 [Candidatus Pacearchaeota archaeon]|nr:hypothetical protein [Candidatus Pacearchaeota archaeon]
MKSNKIKLRKAQTPSTLTWVVGFIIIFFIIFLFVSFSVGMAAPRKAVSSVSGLFGKTERSSSLLVEATTSAAFSNFNQIILFKERQTSLKQEILSYVKGEVSYSELGSFIASLNQEIFKGSNFVFHSVSINDKSIFNKEADPTIQSKCLSPNSIVFFYPSEDKFIKIKLGLVDCEGYVQKSLTESALDKAAERAARGTSIT